MASKEALTVTDSRSSSLEASLLTLVERVERLEDGIGGEQMEMGPDILAIIGGRRSSPRRNGLSDSGRISQSERSLLSYVRELDRKMSRFDESRGMGAFIKLFDQNSYLIESSTVSAEGILSDLRVKEKRVLSCSPMIQRINGLLSEFNEHKSAIKKELPHDSEELEKRLVALETVVEVQSELAVEIQKNIEELMSSYTQIINAVSHKMLEMEAYTMKMLLAKSYNDAEPMVNGKARP
mmetsp:Transcript_20666/g.50736  ORF Transcript_20666/g.50736 Transcript_20666/m.50736 type:complete len:238 (+) Transcript_20666:57-770(+)